MTTNAKDRSPTRTLAQAIDKKRDQWTNVFYMRYEQPRGNGGQHWVTDRESGQPILVSSTVGRKTFAPGSLVPVAREAGGREYFIIGEPPPGKQGAAEFARRWGAPVNFDYVVVSRAVPDVLNAGVVNQDVTIYGFGFREDPIDFFMAAVYDPGTRGWIADPSVTVHDPFWVSAQQVEVQVDVAATVLRPYKITVKVERA